MHDAGRIATGFAVGGTMGIGTGRAVGRRVGGVTSLGIGETTGIGTGGVVGLSIIHISEPTRPY